MKIGKLFASKFGQNSKKAEQDDCLTQNDSAQGKLKGRAEENFAEHFLQQQGLITEARNFRSRYGEIDLIMHDGATIVFIEVRQRKHHRYGSPLESVTRNKQEKLRKTAEYYLINFPSAAKKAMRFDVLALTGTLPNFTTEWVQNAF